MKKVLLVFALAMGLAGCATLQQLLSGAFKKPRLTFHSVQLQDLALSGMTLNVIYTLENPNPLGLSLAEVDYALSIDGKQVVAGKPPKGLEVAPKGRTQLVFPANIKFADVAPVLQTFLTKDYATYRAQGSIGVQTPIGILKFPVSKEDQFEVPKLPQVALNTPRISNLTLTSATVELPLMVTNRNTYALPIQGVGGQVSIAGANVGSLSTGDLGALTGKQTREVRLPITINFLSAAAAAAALRGGNGTVAFSGQVQSGGASLPINFSQNLSFRR